ncbi:hypothetical protein trd_A0493 (plasmid) [Thermomicrobium roseum DSM 5159]|uniref:Uncharacterized protein n=1 Tax=Thermomicrobium roseum (strain ATCC 27502 / DSM 5159 / P-2) TaxID=309801 RepID=B9L3X9_THERP|nr:hypothetical protein trd_A0493 [Thermomicrobium roseum DSM 5159]
MAGRWDNASMAALGLDGSDGVRAFLRTQQRASTSVWVQTAHCPLEHQCGCGQFRAQAQLLGHPSKGLGHFDSPVRSGRQQSRY